MTPSDLIYLLKALPPKAKSSPWGWGGEIGELTHESGKRPEDTRNHTYTVLKSPGLLFLAPPLSLLPFVILPFAVILMP